MAMPFYIYENWRAGPHKAVIHHGSCGYCNEGEGKARGYNPGNANWHGPFSTLNEARQASASMHVIEHKECRCIKKLEMSFPYACFIIL
jgi:F-type H+-transporting ATPase subunit beta